MSTVIDTKRALGEQLEAVTKALHDYVAQAAENAKLEINRALAVFERQGVVTDAATVASFVLDCQLAVGSYHSGAARPLAFKHLEVRLDNYQAAEGNLTERSELPPGRYAVVVLFKKLEG
jgi:predicted RNA polymerase sigma factor